MDGLLVVAVKVLVDAILLNHKDFATHPQQFVQLVGGQFVERFLVQCHIRTITSAYKVHRLPFLTFGVRDRSLRVDALQQEGHIVGHGAHGLQALGIQCGLALVAAIGFGVDSYRNRPKDTFSDPQQAYAMLEASLSYISSKMEKGMDSITSGTGAVLTRTSEIMDNIN